MAIIIAGERSGVGKTTITLAMLAYLRRLGKRVQSFKVGPDYIDPMFHRYVTGRPCYNLDPVLTSEAYVQHSFAIHSQDAELALVEGVMGLFDGATGAEDIASTAHIARLLDIPVVLILDCARLSRSVAAIAHGYRTFDPRLKLAGVILNRVGSDRHLTLLQEALATIDLPILGVLHRHADLTLPDRHLGLVPTDELPNLEELCDRLATLAADAFCWDTLLPLLHAEDSPQVNRPYPFAPSPSAPSPTLAVARDRAFSFYYPDNLALLESLGARLQFWSPLEEDLPKDVSGVYFGGGFPEMFAAELAANRAALQSVRQAIATGMPIYAECGGLMYLSQGIVDFAGKAWELIGTLPTWAEMGDRLTLGYRRAIAQHNTPVVTAGQVVWGHEFHRSQLATTFPSPLYKLHRFEGTPVGEEGWHSAHLHASYLHLHWGASPNIPQRFLNQVRQFAQPLTLAQ
ncbi:MAG: cobyrinate a,c-diamide synthase [Cyanobacteria bacterium J06638_22]